MSPSAKKFLANTSLIVFAFVIAFSICEVFTRLLYKDESMLFPRYQTDYQYGPYTIRGIRPNEKYWMTSIDGTWKYTTNNRGFRNTKDFEYAKPANTLRVLSLGDSHTQGYEVRQNFTFSAVLERFLNHNSRKAEVINSGVSGFSTAEELVFLENEGIKYNPDVVILGFFANDFEDNLKAGLFGLDSHNHITKEKYEHIPGVFIQNVIYSIPGVQWLSENSYFYSLLFNNVWNYFKAKFTREAQSEFAVATSTTVSGYPVALAGALIEHMHQFCKERGIRFIVVDIPVLSEHYSFKSSVPQELLQNLQSEQIEFISSQSLLKNFDGVAEMHVPHGHNHISELTHTLIGMEIGHRLLATEDGSKNK